MLDYTPVTLAGSFTAIPASTDWVRDPETGEFTLVTTPATMSSLDVSTTTAYLPSRLMYPTGTNLRFYYTSYGQIHKWEKWVPTITGQGSERMIARTGD